MNIWTKLIYISKCKKIWAGDITQLKDGLVALWTRTLVEDFDRYEEYEEYIRGSIRFF